MPINTSGIYSVHRRPCHSIKAWWTLRIKESGLSTLEITDIQIWNDAMEREVATPKDFRFEPGEYKAFLDHVYLHGYKHSVQES